LIYFWHEKWDGIQQAAIGSHGIITFAQAKVLGVHPVEIYRWVASGRLMKLNRGVFRLTAYPFDGLVSDMAAGMVSWRSTSASA
jgi:hypothetical protein